MPLQGDRSHVDHILMALCCIPEEEKLARLGLAIEIVLDVTFKVRLPDADSFRYGNLVGQEIQGRNYIATEEFQIPHPNNIALFKVASSIYLNHVYNPSYRNLPFCGKNGNMTDAWVMSKLRYLI